MLNSPEIADLPGAAKGARSALVVLIRSLGRVIGMIDLVAEEAAAFGEVDRCILRAVADGLGGLVAPTDEAPAPDA